MLVSFVVKHIIFKAKINSKGGLVYNYVHCSFCLKGLISKIGFYYGLSIEVWIC